jgi:hypothetical protein
MSKRISQYHVVRATKLEDFNHAVNQNIAIGWQPFGELQVVVGSGFYQVMVRYADETTTDTVDAADL